MFPYLKWELVLIVITKLTMVQISFQSLNMVSWLFWHSQHTSPQINLSYTGLYVSLCWQNTCTYCDTSVMLGLKSLTNRYNSLEEEASMFCQWRLVSVLLVGVSHCSLTWHWLLPLGIFHPNWKHYCNNDSSFKKFHQIKNIDCDNQHGPRINRSVPFE